MPKGKELMPDVQLKLEKLDKKTRAAFSQKIEVSKAAFRGEPPWKVDKYVEGKFCISSRKTSFQSSPERIELADLLMHWALEYGILTWIFLMRWAPISQVYVFVTLNPSKSLNSLNVLW